MQYFKRRFRIKRFIIFITLLIGLFGFFVFSATAQIVSNTSTNLYLIESNVDINNYSTDSSIVVENNLLSDTNVAKINSQPFANISFVNQYLWRGTLLDSKPNLQPILGFDYGNFEIGVIGSLSLLNNYSEVDLYASYKYKSFKLCVTDLYVDLSGSSNNQEYFNYSDTAGYHHVMLDLTYLGTERFPLKLTASTMIHSGWDLNVNGKSKYTTYFEAKYSHKSYDFFVGALTGGSDFYLNDCDRFNVVNVGVAYNYNIQLGDICSVPFVSQLCINPQMQKIYLNFCVTF